MRKVKIINLLHHPPISFHTNHNDPEYVNKYLSIMEYIKINKKPYWIGFAKNNHHHYFAKKIKRATNNYQIECWRPYGDIINKVYEKEVDGILHKVFPSVRKYYYGFGTFMYSELLLKEIINEQKKNDIILIFHDGHSRFVNWLLMKLNCFNIPIIYIQRSSSFGRYRYENTKGIKKLNIFPLYYFYFIELKVLNTIDYYVSGNRTEIEVLKNNNHPNYNLLAEGIDLNFFKPPEVGKEKIKIELELPIEKKIVLYVSWFTEPYDVDILIRTYNSIRRKDDKIQLVMIGGSKNDEFYNMAIDSGAIVKERVESEILVKYYQSANLFVMPYNNYVVVNFGGMGNTILEATACGLPTISNNLIHFPGTKEERDKIGMLMGEEKDLEEKIYYMLNNIQKYTACRAIAEKYFDEKKTMNIYLAEIEKLIDQYYKE